MDGFSLSKTWKKSFKDFAVGYKRWEDKPLDPYDGPYKWNVYVYIYPSHPLFQKFTPDTKLHQASLPGLHGGASRFWTNWRKNTVTGELEVCSYEIGSDYGHYRDDYTHDEEPPTRLLLDVKDLIEFMEEYAGTSSPY